MNPSEIEIWNAQLEARTPEERLEFAVQKFGERLLFTSSFGAGSGVLLHMWSRVARRLPVVFIDTGFLFPETLAYRDLLARRLDLTIDVVRPRTTAREFLDAHGEDVQVKSSDFCCEENKLAPLRPRLARAKGWISGLRRDQSGARQDTPILLASEEGPIKVHPLATMTAAEAKAYMERHEIPEHPLRAEGYASIGCAPCTRAILPGEDERAGRWAWSGKTECGLHTRLVRKRAP